MSCRHESATSASRAVPVRADRRRDPLRAGRATKSRVARPRARYTGRRSGASASSAARWPRSWPMSPRLSGPVSASTGPRAARFSRVALTSGRKSDRVTSSPGTPAFTKSRSASTPESPDSCRRRWPRRDRGRACRRREGRTRPEQAGKCEAQGRRPAESAAAGVMATAAPAKRVAPVRGSLNVCRGWKTRVAAPASSQGSSTETDVAPLVWATTRALSAARSPARRGVAPPGSGRRAQLRAEFRGHAGDGAVGHADE